MIVSDEYIVSAAKLILSEVNKGVELSKELESAVNPLIFAYMLIQHRKENEEAYKCLQNMPNSEEWKSKKLWAKENVISTKEALEEAFKRTIETEKALLQNSEL